MPMAASSTAARPMSDLLWNSLMRTLDPGTMGGDTGPFGFLLGMLAVTLGGIFIISALIGIINTGLEGKLAELRKGRSRVIETGHTVILGWSQQIFTIVSELVAANANQARSSIVILADHDKVEMEDEIRDRLPQTGRTTVVCRSGNPIDIDDLEIARLETSRAIIILSPETDDPDADVIKTMLAITNNPRRRPEPYHIVAELRDADEPRRRAARRRRRGRARSWPATSSRGSSPRPAASPACRSSTPSCSTSAATRSTSRTCPSWPGGRSARRCWRSRIRP